MIFADSQVEQNFIHKQNGATFQLRVEKNCNHLLIIPNATQHPMNIQNNLKNYQCNTLPVTDGRGHFDKIQLPH